MCRHPVAGALGLFYLPGWEVKDSRTVVSSLIVVIDSDRKGEHNKNKSGLIDSDKTEILRPFGSALVKVFLLWTVQFGAWRLLNDSVRVTSRILLR